MSQRLWMVLALAMQLYVEYAKAQVLNSALNESVVTIPKKARLFTVQLEATIYKPASSGLFPIVVINHGKAAGNPRFQSRYRPASAARYFLQRGYAVVVPMRQGFSNSEGSYIAGGCNIESNGLVQAEDVVATLDSVVQQPWADKDRIVVAGQSHGGWTTLAFGTRNYPGVRGLINFAGGLRQENCAAWEGGLAHAAAVYAQKTQVPSIWFYGDNDSYFSPFTFRTMFERYTGAGGQAELVDFGVFENDAHSMFGSRKGESIWQPRVEAFLHKLGLPTQVVHPEFSLPPVMEPPPASNHAGLTMWQHCLLLVTRGVMATESF